ncbi:Tetratricopeptide repeat [Carpediemonas membranifera]|uniref:Tetratricopeptide repeat n=1 Tax=Carpediemonas membranifera TaxID=201153 RepID=A0A8J6ASI5_9EUKA|nr:Tetratricopeptide repeat [Carpediemonas membranifera]|eukprot:KAG9390390.1 Tetratricopeptide repeat [Carpediemonas membranifera]
MSISAGMSPLQRSWSKSSMDQLERVNSQVQMRHQHSSALFDLQKQAYDALCSDYITDALKFANQALNSCKKMYGSRHTEVVYPLLLLAEIHLKMNRMDNTQKCLNAARKIITGAPGVRQTDPLYRQYLMDQGKVLVYDGMYQEALKTFTELKTLIDGEEANQTTDLAPSVRRMNTLRLAVLNTFIGTCRLGLGHISQALVAHMSAYRQRRAILGSTALDTALSACHVATVYMHNGETGVALKIFKECRKILEGQGDTAQRSPDLATLYLNISICEMVNSTHSSAPVSNKAAMDALQLRISTYGGNSLNTAIAQLQLGRCIASSYDYNGAMEYVEQARQTLNNVLGPGHVLTASADAVHASILLQLGRTAESRQTIEQCHAVFSKQLGPSHEQTLAAASMIADLLLADGETEEAQTAWAKILKARESASGERSLQAASAKVSTANVWRQAGKLKEAASMYKAALTTIKGTLGPNHRLCATIYINLGGLLVAADRGEQGRRFLTHGLTIRQRCFGENHMATVHARLALGQAGIAVGDYEAALAELQSALAVLEAVFGPEHEETRAVKRAVASVLRNRILARKTPA